MSSNDVGSRRQEIEAKVHRTLRSELVRLTDLVPNEPARQAAERDAWMLFGVDTVVNEINVEP